MTELELLKNLKQKRIMLDSEIRCLESQLDSKETERRHTRMFITLLTAQLEQKGIL